MGYDRLVLVQIYRLYGIFKERNVTNRMYDQSLLCNTGCCPVVDEDVGALTLHDPAFPAQGKIRFASKDELRVAFDAAVATHSLTVHHPETDETYSFKNREEQLLFGQNAFTALEAS